MKDPHFTPEITDDFVKMHEDFLVPAIYAQWAHRVAEIAKIDLGHHVLDVACGTGVLARAALLEAGLTGKVTGLDASEKMLESANKHSRKIEWRHGDAEALPFEENQFDRVMCQFSLMFIANRVSAIKEMLRVCKPDGLVVVAIWAPMEHSKAYCTLNRLVQKHAGAHAAFKLSSPWKLGAPGVMDALLLSSGVNEYECHQRVGLVRFPSIESFIESHLRMVGEFHQFDKEAYRQLLIAADSDLHEFLVPGGQIVAQLDANIFIINDV
jgi:ubiquinone/menaquinone biosynthesis C-methylase UbiE